MLIKNKFQWHALPTKGNVKKTYSCKFVLCFKDSSVIGLCYVMTNKTEKLLQKILWKLYDCNYPHIAVFCVWWRSILAARLETTYSVRLNIGNLYQSHKTMSYCQYCLKNIINKNGVKFYMFILPYFSLSCSNVLMYFWFSNWLCIPTNLM